MATEAPAPSPAGTRTTRDARFWIFGFLPLVLLAVALVLFARFGPVGVFDAAFPPVEELTIERLTFDSQGVHAYVVNGGPETVTIAQVTVDEAVWNFTVDPNPEIPRLGRATVNIPYPWVQDEPLGVALIVSDGVIFEASADVATPSPDAEFLSTFALLGIYAGVIPVFIGLLWLPFLSRLSYRWLNFFLSLTIGLLLFLGVEAFGEAIEGSEGVASAFQGLGLLTVGFLLAFLAVSVVDRWRGRAGTSGTTAGLLLSYVVAIGIGLHNLGEGLAIGAAYATGAISLGAFLVIGFATHNTTEGLAIVAPISKRGARPSRLPLHLVILGAIAGVPTVFGAWLGGFAFSPIWSTLFLAVGAGAIFQVVWQLARMVADTDEGSLASALNASGLAAGLLIMYGTGLLIL